MLLTMFCRYLPAAVGLFRALYSLCQSSRILSLKNVHSFQKKNSGLDAFSLSILYLFLNEIEVQLSEGTQLLLNLFSETGMQLLMKSTGDVPQSLR